MTDDGLDDLFADENLDETAAAPGLPLVSRGLICRTDELRVSGCSQYVRPFVCATPHLSLLQEGCLVKCRLYRQHLQEWVHRLWDLSEGDEAKIISLAHNGHPLKHLSWNHSGTELAVIDTLGDLSIFSLLITVNFCHVSRRCALGAEDNLSAVVGLMWLNQDRSTPNGQWTFVGTRFKLSGPHNPHLLGEQPGKNKAALVVVTQSGVIRLIYQGPNGGRWLDFQSELQSASTASELLTHVAICADQDSSLLVATHSISKCIRVYRVEINWSKQEFIINHFKTIADCSPASDDGDVDVLADNSQYSEAQLYNLELIAPLPDVQGKEALAPLLLAFFSNPSYSDDNLQMGSNPSTSIARWELISSKPMLHPNFLQLASKRSGASSPKDLQSEVGLRRLAGIRVDRIILAVQQLNLGTTLVFCLDDGSIEFRNRTTLNPLPQDDTPAQASSIAQVGLKFPDSNPCLHAALSPNACAVVTFDDEDAMTLRLMQMLRVYPESSLDPDVVEAVAEAFVMQFSISRSGYGNYQDDLTAVMQLFQDQHLKGDHAVQAPRFLNPFLSDMYRVSQLNLDFSGDIKSELYLKNSQHQKTLSMQFSLGYWGNQGHPTMSSKVAFAILQLRWTALTFAMGLKSNPALELKRIEILRSFFGIISWTLALMNFVIDELFTLAVVLANEPATGDRSLSAHAVTAKILELNTPALALLFISQSRLLLKYNFRFLRGFSHEAIQQQSQDPTWRVLSHMFSISPVPLHEAEKVLLEVDAGIRNVYESERISEADRRDIERSMLITGSVSPRLWSAVENLLVNTVKELKEEVDVAELYFHDISWLGLSDDKASDEWKKQHRLDVIRKVEVPKGARVRQCTRCCSVMEDSAPPKGTAGLLVNMWRTCVCGNWWMSMKDESAKADGLS
ncbi:MAG: hypothetical protein Q9219_000429 [cf. Caloplaca sp. 3 TL-2023]